MRGLLAAVFAATSCKPATRAAAPDPIRWSVASVKGDLRPGSSVTLHLAAAIDSGWYIYSLTQKPGGPTPMSVTVSPTPPFAVSGAVEGPQPVVVFDKEFGINTERYAGSPAFVVPVTVSSVAGVRPETLSLGVRYQVCNATLCLPSRTTTVMTPVRIADQP